MPYSCTLDLGCHHGFVLGILSLETMKMGMTADERVCYEERGEYIRRLQEMLNCHLLCMGPVLRRDLFLIGWILNIA